MAFDSTEVAWRDITVSLNGQILGKVKRLKYKTARETEHLHGAGDEAFDINPGNKVHTGELVVFKSVLDSMNLAAKAAGFDDVTDLPWILNCAYKATATAPKTSVTLPNVRFEEFESGGENNGKAIEVTLPFKCLKPETV
jgi:hypothetical protein